MEIGNKLGLPLAGARTDMYTLTSADLEDFYQAIVKECAQIAEDQSRVYTGEKNEAAGCYSAASAIRVVMGVTNL